MQYSIKMADQNLDIPNLRQLLAEYLGVEPEDINESDSFSVNLHMGPTEISDFLESLRERGMDISRLNIEDIDTVEQLNEALELHQGIN